MLPSMEPVVSNWWMKDQGKIVCKATTAYVYKVEARARTCWFGLIHAHKISDEYLKQA